MDRTWVSELVTLGQALKLSFPFHKKGIRSDPARLHVWADVY